MSGGGEGVSGTTDVVGTTWSPPTGGDSPVSSSLDSQLDKIDTVVPVSFVIASKHSYDF